MKTIFSLYAVIFFLFAGFANAMADDREPQNLDLAVERGGTQYYYSQAGWEALPDAQKNECRKLGVVIRSRGASFILTLTTEGCMTWTEAMERFPRSLPTKVMGEEIVHQANAVRNAIKVFGGENEGSAFWTCSSADSPSVNDCAWIIAPGIARVFYESITITPNVRLVYPLE